MQLAFRATLAYRWNVFPKGRRAEAISVAPSVPLVVARIKKRCALTSAVVMSLALIVAHSFFRVKGKILLLRR
jgi:hypothetical protein